MQGCNSRNMDMGFEGFARLLRDWRQKRRWSQLDLALTSGVSQRHISFLESSRANPSRAMILQLSEALDVPLRERNQWLTAAGFAPLYRTRTLDDPQMAQVMGAVRMMLSAHEPYPALALDRAWNVLIANRPFEALTALLGGHVQASIGNPLEFMGHLKSGAVRAIGVFRDNRFADLPNVPTMKEQGIKAENFQMWRGVAVPRQVPDAAAAYWTEVMKRVVATETWKKYLRDNVASSATIVGTDFTNFLAAQEKLYRELLGRPS
jgi:transcriptional regulator with XRE-family HTH domain